LWRAKWDKFGGEIERVEASDLSLDADWSPDGRWLVFESWRNDNANHDIYIMTAAGGEIQQLTNDSFKDYQPVWRPPIACQAENVNEC
jgi:Tol biopolymer transport system component